MTYCKIMFTPTLKDFPFDVQHLNLKLELTSCTLDINPQTVISFNFHRANAHDVMLRFKSILLLIYKPLIIL